ncbi:MAG: hypothetical protein QOE57_306 [Acidimicrobiaceae bacterium]|nr:hypothetical protein [Acidimicrobiaceae bacterium]
MELDRRTFLRRCGEIVVLSAAARIGLDVFTPLGQSARAAALASAGPLPGGTPILVLIDLQGGNDAVNMLINPSDPYYYDVARGHGNIAIKQSSILALTGTTLGLHPSMQWLAGRWKTVGDLAFVQGSGENTKHEFSHFAASYYRNVADFGGSEGRGWLGRYNDQMATGSPFASVSLNGVHPALIGALTPVLTVNDVASFAFDVDWHWRTGLLGAWQSMGGGGSLSSTMLAAAKQNIADSFATESVVAASQNASIGASFSGNFGRQMANAAMLIQAGFPSQTYVASFGGFDTHGSEAWTQADLLTQLDGALNHFFSIVGAGPRAQDVFVMVTSEFGRQHTANASAGCDHGQAGVNIILGGGVAGGLYGQAPLTDPTHRLNDALLPTVDFRSVYATVLNRLSGNPNLTAGVMKSPFADLGIFNGSHVPPPPPTTAPSTTAPPPTTAPPTTVPAGGGTTTTTIKRR